MAPARTRLQRLCQWLGRRHPLPIIALGLLLAAPALVGGVAMDDLMIRSIVREDVPVSGISRPWWEAFTFLDGIPEHNQRLMNAGWLPFWTDLRCRAAFFRPLTGLTGCPRPSSSP